MSMLNDLAKAYPKAINPDNPVPLAMGAHKQVGIQFNLKESRKALRKYCRSRAYLLAVAAPGAARYNLDGSIAGPVSGQHAHAAQRWIHSRGAT